MSQLKRIPNRGNGSPATGDPPTSTNTNIATRQTRKSNLPQEEIEAISSTVMNIENAKEYLTKNLLCHIDQPFTLTHLISVLFHITQLKGIPLPAIEAIRAVAFLLKKNEACEIANLITDHINRNLSSKIAEHVVTAIAPQAAKILTTTEKLEETIKAAEHLRNTLERENEEKRNETTTVTERLEEAAGIFYESAEECHKSIKNLTPSLDKTQEQLTNISIQLENNQPRKTNINNNDNKPNQQPQASYSSIAAAHLPPSVDQALARAAIRARQIILDPLPGGNMFPPNTSHADVVKTIKEALNDIKDDSTPTGNIRAVTTFRNGGLLIELENEPLATWLRTPTNSKALANKLGPTVSFRSSAFPIVIEYLPVNTQINNESFLRTIEQENDLPENSLISIKWIKPVTRRSQEQKKAFALLQTINAPTANRIIKDGLCIQNDRFPIRKDKKEPIRCAKCQRFRHIARNCSSPTDVCGNCGGQHRTSECNAYKTEYCTNCKSGQHTSWSRKCPEFKRRLDTLNDSYLLRLG